MIVNTSFQVKKAMDEIDSLVREALNHDFITDKVYVRIITKIGNFDDAILRAQSSSSDEDYLNWAKNRLDKICQMFVDEQETAIGPSELGNDEFMHPTGDYYNEDNSFTLSGEVKSKLKELLSEEYRGQKQ